MIISGEKKGLTTVCDTGMSSDNSSVPVRQMSPGADDYTYDYDYETLDDEAMIGVEQLNIEYVDDLALTDDQLDSHLGLGRPAHENVHRRRRPHSRYITGF